MGEPPAKTCASCGRRIEWRRKWARSWDDVRYCSAACRRRKVSAADLRLEEALRALLAQRRDLIDPHEVAQPVDGSVSPEAEEAVRRAARRLVAAGDAEIVQHGRVVDPSSARGTIHLRRSSRHR